MFESEVIAATDQAEESYRRAGRLFLNDDSGRMKSIGRLYDSGPQVDRVRRVVDALTPPYLNPDDFRAYVIDNKEWNASAMGNRSIYVYGGLLKDLDDDELATVLGHEMVHATHEHTRRRFKKQMWIQLAALGIGAAASEIQDDKKRAVVELVTLFGGLGLEQRLRARPRGPGGPGGAALRLRGRLRHHQGPASGETASPRSTANRARS